MFFFNFVIQDEKTLSFIERSKKCHLENEYDYSMAQYVNQFTPVLLKCNKCNQWFYQIPKTHLRGAGCTPCIKTINGKKRMNNTNIQEKIEQAKKIHNNYYDYSKVEWKGETEKVEIVCPKHGSFFMKLSNHILLKQKCPKCAFEIRYSYLYDKEKKQRENARVDNQV